MVDHDTMRSIAHARTDLPAERNKEESRLVKVKRMLTESVCRRGVRAPPATAVAAFEEARAAQKARKRKERQESISSVSQERKVIRSSSEERPPPAPATDDKEMRRVLSHENVQQVALPLQEKNEKSKLAVDARAGIRCSPQRYPRMDILDNDDCERRRSHERFARPLAPRGRRSDPGRKKKKHRNRSHCKENNNNNNNNNNEQPVVVEPKDTSDLLQRLQEEERSPSPAAPALDLTTLHEQIDCVDPIPSLPNHEISEEIETLPGLSVATNRMLSSPRNSIMITHRIYLDPNVQQTKSTIELEPRSPREKKLKQVSRQIASLKRRMRQLEEEFEVRCGYKPSQAERIGDREMRKVNGELVRLKKEYRLVKEDGEVPAVREVKKERTLRETMDEIEKRLLEKKLNLDRGTLVEEMTNEEALEEKVAIQKALLYLEALHGRPSARDARDIVRPLYERYRSLKRMLVKIAIPLINTDLPTILEHETMDFVSAAPSSTDTDTMETVSNPPPSTDSDTDVSLGETNLHNLTHDELVEHKRDALEEKKQLKRALREHESMFQARTGRKLQKDDRAPLASVYYSYKQVKARLRLLDALLRKQHQVTSV